MSRSLYFVTLAFLLWLPGSLAFATDGIDRGLLWRVEHPDADEPSYVFGTIHSAREAVVDLPDAVAAAFDSAERYRFELDFSQVDQATAMQHMMYGDGSTLPEALNDDLWERTRDAAAQRGIPESSLKRLKPWAVALTLSMPRQNPTQTLDYQLYERARARNKPVAGLETMDEQMSIFDDLETSLQIEFLRNTVRYHEQEQLEPLFDELIELYLDADLAGMVEVGEEHPGLGSADDQEAFMQRLVEQRNRIMVTRMGSALRKGGTFVAIGALHLPGEDGIIRRLEEQGYAVTRAD